MFISYVFSCQDVSHDRYLSRVTSSVFTVIVCLRLRCFIMFSTYVAFASLTMFRGAERYDHSFVWLYVS